MVYSVLKGVFRAVEEQAVVIVQSIAAGSAREILVKEFTSGEKDLYERLKVVLRLQGSDVYK